jgi:hypothetical protein
MYRCLYCPWKRPVLALLLFGTAFGYLEAAVVSYLRYLHEPIVHRFYPNRPAGELFPLLTREQSATAGPRERKVRITELWREAATIVMLGAVALAISTNPGQWFAAFIIAFGAWDITFYVFFKILLDWPASLLTWDVLFIIPVVWVGPVFAPVLVSAAMIAAGVWHLRREATGIPVRLGIWNWAGIVAGAGVIIVSFTLDYANLAAGGIPQHFNWLVFAVGLSLGTAAYVKAAVRRKTGAVMESARASVAE